MRSGLRRHLRTPVLIGWVVAFISLYVFAIWISDGFGFDRSTLATELRVLALVGSALFALCLAHVPRVQRWALRPGSSIVAIRNELRFLALFAGLLGLALAIDIYVRG